jgi:hypothetical protein
MTKWIGAAILMLGLMFDGPATINDAAAAPLQTAVQKPDTSEKTGFSARRPRQALLSLRPSWI